MALSYTKKEWTDTSASGTAITADSLNNIENGIGNVTAAVNNMTKATNNTGIKFTITSGREFNDASVRYGNIVFIDFDCACGPFTSWEVWEIGTAPKPICNTWTSGMCFLQNGSAAPNILDLQVTNSCKIRVQNKSGATLPGGWLFGKVIYICE